jgi:hypothetical protein
MGDALGAVCQRRTVSARGAGGVRRRNNEDTESKNEREKQVQHRRPSALRPHDHFALPPFLVFDRTVEMLGEPGPRVVNSSSGVRMGSVSFTLPNG